MLENGDVWPKFEDGIAAAAAAAEREAKRIPLLFLPLGAEEGKGTELTEASEGGDDSDGWMDGAHALALSLQTTREADRSFVQLAFKFLLLSPLLKSCLTAAASPPINPRTASFLPSLSLPPDATLLPTATEEVFCEIPPPPPPPLLAAKTAE